MKRLSSILLLLAMLSLTGPCLAGASEDVQAGELARKRGDCDKAIELFTRALGGDLPKKQVLAAHALRGYCFEDKGLYDQAIGDFDIVLRMSPENQEALCGLGNAYLRKGNYSIALKNYNEALRLNPQFTEAYVNRGVAYRSIENYDKAETDFKHALSQNPKDATALRDMGELHLQMGNFGEAQGDFDRLVGLSPDSPLGFYGRGRTLFLTGDFEGAIVAFDRAAQQTKKNLYIVIWRYLAEARMKVNDSGRLRMSAVENSRDWPFPITQYFLGEISRESLVAIADHADKEKRTGQRCEVFAYLAEFDLSRERNDLARRQFQQAHSVCPPNFIEYALITSEQKNLRRK